MPYVLKKTVVLVGMMGSGKSAIGSALSQVIDVPFNDLDREIEMAAQATIAEIFTRDGEAFFRKREHQVLERMLKGTPSVLSTGGGAFMAQNNRDLIGTQGFSVCLGADVDLLWSRVRHKTTRPLLQTADPLATLTEIYNERAATYALADIVVEGRPEYSIEKMTDQVVKALISNGVLSEGK